MKIKWILFAISIVIVVCPIGGALVAYRDRLEALVVPETPEFVTKMPEIEFLDYQTDTRSLRYRIINPYNMNLTISSYSAEVFCSEHDVLIGIANETTTTNVPAKNTTIVSMMITYIPQGIVHYQTSHFGKSALFIDIRNLTLIIQGIKRSSSEQTSYGPVLKIP